MACYGSKIVQSKSKFIISEFSPLAYSLKLIAHVLY